MNCKKKLFEIYEPVLVSVECSEHMITELLGVSCSETIAIDLHKRVLSELPIWTVLPEAPVPGCDGVHAVVGVRSQELQVLFGQSFLLGCLCTHCYVLRD